MIKLIIFDLDGTLVNSIEDLADAVNYALAKNGHVIHELQKYNHFVGDGVQLLIKRALPENASDELIFKVKEDFSEYYNQLYTEKTELYPGINELIKALKQRNIQLAVASNKPDEFTKAIVLHFFGNIFSYVQGNTIDIPK